jgi:hypothetical protein
MGDRSSCAMANERSEPEVHIVEVPVPLAGAPNADDMPRPRRISLKKIHKMIERKETRWFGRHIAPLYDLIEARAIATNTLMAYARLWQLERWLRDLLQLELQAAYGPAWLKRIPTAAIRQGNAAPPNAYMASVDDKNRSRSRILITSGSF